MPTGESSIEAALFARVASLEFVPALPVAWPNTAFTPPESYLRVNHIPGAANRIFIGSDEPHQRLGVLQVTLFAPKNGGVSSVTEIAGTVAAHFPADLKMSADGVAVRVTKVPEVAQALADETHWHVSVSIAYEAVA